MDENTQMLKNQIQQLPAGLKKYLDDGHWTKEVRLIASKFNLEEYQIVLVENEVLFVLIGMEPYADLKENIQREADINPDVAELLVEEISINILDQIDIPEYANDTSQESREENQTQNNVGSDFEQIILNQAKAMQSAIAPPSNLPIGDKSKPVHDYKSGADPYREPIE